MELLQLKYFCDAAETEKFSRTAEKFLVPVSNISQSVKRLEKELGIELFNHIGNKITLNSNGKKFYDYASKALELIENGKACVTDSNDSFKGDIRLLCATNYKTVSAAIEDFLKKHPDVNFIIHQTAEAGMEFDIIISDIFPHEHNKKALLIDEEMFIAMKKSHPLSEKKEISISDLRNERFIALSTSNSIKNITISACTEAGFYPNITIQTYSTAFLRRYIQMGLGISFVPASWEEKYSEDIAFKKVGSIRRKTYAFIPKLPYTKRSVEAFFETLIQKTQTPADDAQID